MGSPANAKEAHIASYISHFRHPFFLHNTISRLVLASLMVVDVFVHGNMDGVGFRDWDLNLLFDLNGVGLLDLIRDGLLHRVWHRFLHYMRDNLEQAKLN